MVIFHSYVKLPEGTFRHAEKSSADIHKHVAMDNHGKWMNMAPWQMSCLLKVVTFDSYVQLQKGGHSEPSYHNSSLRTAVTWHPSRPPETNIAMENQHT